MGRRSERKDPEEGGKRERKSGEENEKFKMSEHEATGEKESEGVKRDELQ